MLGERGLHVDDALVAGAAEMEGLVAFGLDEGAVDQHVDKFEEGTLTGITQQLFEGEAGIAPDVLVGARLDGPCQFGEALGLVHRVAASEGDVGIGVGLDDAHDLLGGHGMPA